jgi:IS4 transposase
MDRGYVDFERLFRIDQSGAFFVTRPLCTTRMLRQYSRVVARDTGLRADQTVRLNGVRSHRDYPLPLRRVSYRDPATGKKLVFLTNNFLLPALTIAQLYQSRWSIEVFFKWIKQHLRITSFLGNSPNAIKTQIWIAVSVYVLIAIAKKRIGVKATLYTFLEVVGLTLFEKMPILQVFEQCSVQDGTLIDSKQLTLFNF